MVIVTQCRDVGRKILSGPERLGGIETLSCTCREMGNFNQNRPYSELWSGQATKLSSATSLVLVSLD